MVSASQCCDYDIDWSNISDLCTIMPRRLLMSGILIQWLREHFSSEDNIEDPMLIDKIWTAEYDTTNIVIDAVYNFQANLTEFRPGIFVKAGTWKVTPYGIDNRKTTSAIPGSCCKKLIEEYNTFYQGSHTIFCVAGESAEVEILANEVFKELVMFGPAARSKFGMMRFGVSDLGEPELLEEATENFVVPITVSYGLSETWRICTIVDEE